VLRLDRIWVSTRNALRRLTRHTSAGARIASDHLPIVAELDLDVLRAVSGVRAAHAHAAG
jgi:endonuclease/exonuclease/phosphatase family metal-dependent hydrolase